MAKIKVTVSTGWANGEHIDYWDVPIGWDKMSKEEQENTLNEYAMEYLHETCGCHAELVEDEDE